jgi:hypothetical protein
MNIIVEKALDLEAYLGRKISDGYYFVKDFFSPHNVIKLTHLPQSWRDVDCKMFHAVFQLLVNFVELEQPFRSWQFPQIKYHTSILEMELFIMQNHINTLVERENSFTTPSKDGHNYYYFGMSNDERSRMDQYIIHKQRIDEEILYLYKWYVNKSYIFDHDYYFNATGQDLEFTSASINFVDTGKPKLITWNEYECSKDEHKILCDVMMQRVINIKDYLWT